MNPEELLTKKQIHYIPKGADLVIRCLNPDHEDKNPSMRIDKISGVFNCLSCGYRGNILNHYGYAISVLTTKRNRLKQKIGEKLAQDIGLEIPANAVAFEDDWRGISGETFRKFEAFQHNDPDFIGRVVFPVRAISGKISVFVGRHQQSNHNQRYMNSPRGVRLPLFPAKVEPIDGRIILVEGILDMINLHDKGLTNAVCTFGTQTLISKNYKDTFTKLQLYRVQGVYGIDLMFDPDDAGQEAAATLKDILESTEEPFDVRNINLKSGDPGDLTALQVLKLKEKLYGEDSSN